MSSKQLIVMILFFPCWTMSISKGNNCQEKLCLLNSYNGAEAPSLVTEVLFQFISGDFYITTLSEVDDHKFTLTLNALVSKFWKDNRIQVNYSDPSAHMFEVPKNVRKKLWIPHLMIPQIKSAKRIKLISIKQDMSMVRGDPNEWSSGFDWNIVGNEWHVGIFEPMELKLLCIMDFSAYPMDTQLCVYKVIPEFGAMSGVRAKWLWLGSGHEFSTRFEAPNLDYTATIRYRNGILRYQLVNITYPEFEIKLVRKYRSHLIETIVPTGLLVAISWISYAIPVNNITARLSLLVTLSLCIINTLNSVARNAPRSTTGTTAQMKWIIICFIFILTAMVEYACILMGSVYLGASATSHQSLKSKTASHRMDRVMAVAMPPIFIVFATVFWTYVCIDS